MGITIAILKQAILAANNSHESSTTVSKMSPAVDPKKHCYSHPSNPYLFIPVGFAMHFVPASLPATLLSALIRVLQNYESYYSKKNISENLDISDVAM